MKPYYEDSACKIYCENCLETMANIPAGTIDLTVTSPPYGKLRDYNGYTFDFEPIAKKLYEITKEGGVVVWVVNDSTVDGSETGAPFRQALYFKDECGFNLHDTMIWIKEYLSFPDDKRYYNAFEYMFVFSKGAPKTINLIADRVNAAAGRVINGSERNRDGSFRKKACEGNIIKSKGIRWNWWSIYNAKRGIHNKHPATFPEKLANDHIISWSNAGDVVYDPFCGSGTTALMARENGRYFVGSEISEEYCDIIKLRMAQDILL